LSTRQFVEAVLDGGNGMPAFREVLDENQILKVHALVVTRDRL
jgi:mono/diheme cytochrome c family protein